MVNQWGRDGNFGSGSAGGSRSAGSFIIPAIIALIIGAGGGYAGGRFFSGVSTSDIAARNSKIAELNKTLSDIKIDSQGTSAQQTTLRQRVRDLEGQVEALKRTKDSLKKYADQQGTKANADAEAEIEALKKTIEQAGDLSGQLNRARKSMKVSELQIIELEKSVSDQKAQIGRLQASLKQTAGQTNPAIAVLTADKERLETQLADVKSQLSDAAALKSRIDALEGQLAKRADAADAEAKQQIAALQKQRDTLQKQLDAAVKASGNTNQLTTKIATLQGQLDEMAQNLADRDQAARDVAQDLKQAKADLGKSEQQLRTLRDQNKALSDAQQQLKQQVISLNATVDSLKGSTLPAENQPATNETNRSDDGQSNTGLTPRDRPDVEKAVEDLPGYAKLGSDKQDTLVNMLEKGECVTDSLKAAYGHVSPISLRSLFRDLGGRC